MSLHQCWAEKVGDSATKVDFWNEFCPQFDWVAPEVVADTATDGGLGYLKAVWDRKRSLHSVNFRKFSQIKLLLYSYWIKSLDQNCDGMHMASRDYLVYGPKIKPPCTSQSNQESWTLNPYRQILETISKKRPVTEGISRNFFPDFVILGRDSGNFSETILR